MEINGWAAVDPRGHESLIVLVTDNQMVFGTIAGHLGKRGQ
jgi:hypothetical protein